MIDVSTYDSAKAWKKLLILWAIHGNEHCWTIAIQRLIDQMFLGCIHQNSRYSASIEYLIRLILTCTQKV